MLSLNSQTVPSLALLIHNDKLHNKLRDNRVLLYYVLKLIQQLQNLYIGEIGVEKVIVG